MSKLVAAIFCLLAAGHVSAAEPMQWGMGVSFESRLEKEVNPGFSDLKGLGVLFQELRMGPWSAIGELGLEEYDSSSGGLNISTDSTSMQIWGRYNFFEPEHWSPFAALGAGVFFDRVTTTYREVSDIRRGRRAMGGLGAGLTNVFWNYLMVEGEVRGAYSQDRREPGISLILRAGVQI